VYEDVSVFLQIRNLECHQQFSSEPMNVTADPSLLTQVFSYLLKNAICFTPDRGEIFVETYLENSWVYFKIRDTGIGLKEDDLERIFDEFYQVTDFENHKTGQFEYLTRGIGVGLSLCKGILTELGGKIWAESPGPNSGSTFTFYLPAVPKE
jgi:signal transduction histidine kinase